MRLKLGFSGLESFFLGGCTIYLPVYHLRTIIMDMNETLEVDTNNAIYSKFSNGDQVYVHTPLM